MKYIHLLPLFVLVALTGCFSLGRETPDESRFVLGASPMPGTISPIEEPGELHLGFRQVRVAEYLDSPLIVVRNGLHQVEYSEFDRWAGTLGGGVTRAMAGYLEVLAPLAVVDVAPWSPRKTYDYLLQVHVLNLEGLAPQGGAHVRASWEIINPLDDVVEARGMTDYKVGNWTVGDYAALVDLLDAGLWQLSHDVVAALTDLRESSRPN